jgi:hypothetical protein
MAESLGEFSLAHTGTAYVKTDDGLTSYASFSGPATGFGSVFGTLNIPLVAKGDTPSGGSVGWAGQGFLDDGTSVAGLGEGTWEQVAGEHRWKISMIVEISNGDRLRSEGEIDLATLKYHGQMYAAD